MYSGNVIQAVAPECVFPQFRDNKELAHGKPDSLRGPDPSYSSAVVLLPEMTLLYRDRAFPASPRRVLPWAYGCAFTCLISPACNVLLPCKITVHSSQASVAFLSTVISSL